MAVADLPVRDTLSHEIVELRRLGHQYQVEASQLLRAGRPGWEAWFEAGLELKRTAERLRAAAGQAMEPPPPITRQPVVAKPVSPRSPVTRYPYAK